MQYTLKLEDDNTFEDLSFSADSVELAVTKANERAEEWVSGGNWGPEGETVTVRITLTGDDGTSSSWKHVVEIEPDHDEMIRQAGGRHRMPA